MVSGAQARWFPAILLTGLVALSRPGAASVFHHQLDDVYVGEAPHGERILPFDDSRPDAFYLLTEFPNRVLCEEFHQGARLAVWDNYFQSPGEVIGLPDVTGDGRADILVLTRGALDSVRVDLYDPWTHPGTVRYTLGPFLTERTNKPIGAAGDVVFWGAVDLDGGGSRTILLSTSPYRWWGEPRRLWAFDGETGAELWSFDSGGIVAGAALLLRRRGQERHLVVSTFAPDNQGFGSGALDNRNSYIFSLTPKGRLEWKTRTGGPSSATQLAVGDLDGDGEDDIVGALDWGLPENRDCDLPSLFVLDPATGATTRSIRLPFSTQSLYLDPALPGRGASILLGSRDETAGLYCFGANLQQRWVDDRSRCNIIVGVRALEAEAPRYRQVVARGTAQLSAVDLNGRLLCREPIPGSADICLLRHLGQTRISVSGGGFRRLYLLRPPILGTDRLSAGGLVILAGVAALLMARTRRVKATRAGESARAEQAHVRRIRAGSEIVDALATYHHGGHSLKQLGNLKSHLANWAHADGAEAAGRSVARDACNTFQKVLFPELCRIAALADESGLAVADARDLLRYSEEARSEIARLQAHPGEDRASARAHAAICSIDDCRRRIKSAVQRAHSAPLEETVVRVLASYASEDPLVDLGRKPVRETPIPPGARVYIDEEILARIVQDLLDNSVAAVAGCADRRIGVVLRDAAIHYQIAVCDTGRGFSPDCHEDVFQEGVTTRPDGAGGLGLSHARSQLMRFGGAIRALEVAPPPWHTVVSLYLKPVED